MRRLHGLLAAGLLCAAFTLLWKAAERPDAGAAPRPPATPATLWQSLEPAFEPNRGQAPEGVLFTSNAPGPHVQVRRQGASFTLPGKAAGRRVEVEMQLVGARADTRLRGEDRQAAVSHYYVGNDPDQWVSGVPRFGRVVYEDAYPGIDAALYGHREGVEYDFLVAPGADPAAIRLRFPTASAVTIEDGGDLLMETANGTARQRAPVAYQESAGGRRTPVAARYRMAGTQDVFIDVGSYDTSRTLVIDPVLVFGTFLETFDSSGENVAVDPAGNIYVVANAIGAGPAPCCQKDVVVLKLSPTGQLLYRTVFGGWMSDFGAAIAADAGGNAWVTGFGDTSNLNREFPRTADAFQPTPAGGNDAFVLKLDTHGALQYSSLLGGSGNETGYGIQVGADGGIHVVGTTSSANFPLESPLQAAPGGDHDVFIAKLDPSGQSLVYSTYLGGSWYEQPHDLAVDTAGRAFVVGSTRSRDFPLANPLQSAHGGSEDDGFVTRIDPTGRVLELSTYLGGLGSDWAYGIALGTAADAWVTGQTGSTNFPLRDAFKTAKVLPSEGFLTRITAEGIVFSSFADHNGRDVAVGPDGSVYMAGQMGDPGWTASKLRTDRSGYEWIFGQRGYRAIAAHPEGGLVVVGHDWGSSFPTYRQTESYARACIECGSAIVLARLADAPLPPAQHDENDPAVSYSGNWTMMPSAEAGGGTLAHTNTSGAWVRIQFTGTGIQIFGRRAPGGGFWTTGTSWSPDGNPVQLYLWSNPPQPRTLLASITGFPPGTHSLTLTNNTPSHHASRDIWFDGYTVLTEGPVPTATPAPTAPTPAPTVTPVPIVWTRVQESDPRLTFSGNWYSQASGNHSGGAARLSMDAGDSVSLTFEGRGFRWIGAADRWSGIATIWIDGEPWFNVDTYRADEKTQVVLSEMLALPHGTHTLKIEVKGQHNTSSGGSWIWVDAIDIATQPQPTPGGTPTPTARPTATASPTMAPTATPTTGPTPSVARIEESDSRIAYTGTWHTNASPNANHSGGTARLAGDPGDTATLTFNGTGVKWQGLKDPWAGIARVFVDGTLRATVDTYSATEQLRQTLFTLDGLPSGSHTIRIDVTGTRNPASGGAWIWVDAFDITNGGAPPTATPTPTATASPTAPPRLTPTATPTPGSPRVEDGDPRIVYAGVWHTNASPSASHSGGTSRLSGEPDATATLTFTGTGVAWHGLRDPWAGIARVYVDGTLRATVDTYSPVEQLRQVLFSRNDMPAGSHTIRIEVSGTRHPDSGGPWIWVDAFDVTP
jgi:hypothetical protein